jgi:ribosomal protein L10
MLPLNALAGPSSRPFLTATRSASTRATAIRKPKNSAPYRGKLSKKSRAYPERKSLLVQEYTELLKASQLVLFLRLQSISVADLLPFRTAIKMLPSASFKLTLLKANLLPPVLRALPTLPSGSLQKYLQGPVAVLTASEVDPAALKAFLAIYDKHSARLNKPPPAPKGVIVKPLERLQLLTGVVESREFDPAGIKRVAALPGLQELRGQIVGLIQASSMGLVQALQAASGQEVVRTLEGFKKGLADSTSDDAASKA